MRILHVPLLLSFASLSCTGLVGVQSGTDAGGTGSGGGTSMGNTGGGSADSDGGCVMASANLAMMKALAPACAGCHTTGSRAYWSSLEAFESQVVYQPRFVVPNDPGASVLIQMLNGNAPGSSRQMPPGQTYASLLTTNATWPTVAQVSLWIQNLPPRGAIDARPKAQNFSIRRLRAEEMYASLLDQLGLQLEDFVSQDKPTWREDPLFALEGRFFVYPKDWVPGLNASYGSDVRAYERFEGLGGAVNLDNRKKDVALGPSALQVITQQSQAWCLRALEKPGNPAILGTLTLTDTSATKSADIKTNIARLHLRMLSEVAPPAFVDAMYSEVFVPLEGNSPKVAWTAVCAAFIRHPLWLSF
jgi:hypothetical protein